LWAEDTALAAALTKSYKVVIVGLNRNWVVVITGLQQFHLEVTYQLILRLVNLPHGLRL